ncbi:MAG: class I SAM-dependent methyltransferase [Bacillota bacterium]|nr:class I SAM-dependent methyltransferase [Bacillota bacterium]
MGLDETGETMVSTKEFEFSLPGLNLSLEIVANMEELITDPEDDERIPYWAELWPAARGLAQYIWESVDFRGESVLELGAGLGLPGLVAALKGGKVTITDYQPPALEIAARNASKNGIEGVTFVCADWRDFPLGARFDWIIGSDILYNPRSNPYVAQIIERNLAPGGQLLFAHPGRKVTNDFIRELVRLKGMKEKQSSLPVLVDHPHFPFYEIDIHHLFLI